MKSLIKLTALICWLILGAKVAYAQTEQDANTKLSDKFEELKKNSNSYQDYKVIKLVKLNAFWQEVTDSLNVLHQNIHTLNKDLQSQKSEITSLNSKIDSLQKSLTDLHYTTDRISFLGIPLLKVTYNTIVWFIIIILAVLGIFFQVRFNRSNRITVQTRKEFQDLSEEFDSFRKRTRENETQLKRDLQTEINKNEELQQMLDNMK